MEGAGMNCTLNFGDLCGRTSASKILQLNAAPTMIPTFVEIEQIPEDSTVQPSQNSPISSTSTSDFIMRQFLASPFQSNLAFDSQNLKDKWSSTHVMKRKCSDSSSNDGYPLQSNRTAPYTNSPLVVRPRRSCASSVSSSEESDDPAIKQEDFDGSMKGLSEDKREKNRQAAQRCRQKKQERVKRLEENARTLQEQNRQLESTVWKLKRERDGIREAYEYHLRNDCPLSRHALGRGSHLC